MNRLARRALIGGVASAISAFFLASALPGRVVAVVLGLVIGAAFALGMLPGREGYVYRLMSARNGHFLVGPHQRDRNPAALRNDALMGSGLRCVRICPALVGRIMYSASVSVHGCDAFTRIFGAEKEFTAPVKAAKHALILGGGSGGMKTAEHPEEELSGDLSVAITLVSDTHAFLFTPMLAEVAGGSLEPDRITTPLRGSLHRTVVVRGD